MTCPECSSKMAVVKTMAVPGQTSRIVECACGVRCLTQEVVVHRLPSAAGNQGCPLVVTGSHGQPPVATGGQGRPPVAAGNPSASAGGVGGGLPSGSGSGSDLHPDSSLLSEPRARERRPRRVTRVEYPDAFEAEWNQTQKTGSKDKACEKWEQLGKPAFGAAWKRWEQSHEWRQEWHNPPHVATWLHDGRFKQEPPAAPPPKAGKDKRCGFHLNTLNRLKRPPGGWYADCPECKDARAAQGGRQSDVAPARDLVAETEARLAAQRNVKPISADELAEMRKLRGQTEPRPPSPGVLGRPVLPAHPGGNSADGSGTASGSGG